MYSRLKIVELIFSSLCFFVYLLVPEIAFVNKYVIVCRRCFEHNLSNFVTCQDFPFINIILHNWQNFQQKNIYKLV